MSREKSCFWKYLPATRRVGETGKGGKKGGKVAKEKICFWSYLPATRWVGEGYARHGSVNPCTSALLGSNLKIQEFLLPIEM